MSSIIKTTICSLVSSSIFGAYYFIFGIIGSSWWLIALGVYYLILSIVRLVVLATKKSKEFITKFTGGMLVFLTIPLIATVILSVVRDRGHVFHVIVMITIALYAFTKITLATINLIRSRRSGSKRVPALRQISFADAAVSIFALQRSMLASFEGMEEWEIQVMNSVIGALICVLVFLLGFNLLIKSKVIFASRDKLPDISNHCPGECDGFTYNQASD